MVRAGLLTGVTMLALQGAAGSIAVAGAPGSPPVARAGPHIDRTITDERIVESSGLAPSIRHPGVLWTHNDSGNAARIYAIGPKGRTSAAVTIRSEKDIDWEAIASLRGPAGSRLGGTATARVPLIAIGDIGDNDAVRSHVQVVLVKEPAVLDDTSVRPVAVLRLRYPGGPRDAEALLADPRDGRLYIVSKALFGADLYAVPSTLWPDAPGSGPTSKVTTLVKVASLPGVSIVTDGTFLPDGRMLLRNYGDEFVLDKPESADGATIRVLATARLPEQAQGESITVTGDGTEALIGSEGKRQPVLKVSVPAVADDPGPSADSQGTRGADLPTAGGSRIAGPTTTVTGISTGTLFTYAGGVLLVALVIGAALTRGRSARRRR